MHKVCSDKIEYLDDLINGFLDKEKETILFEHLDSCEICKKYYVEMTSVKKALGKLNLSAPADTVPNIMRAVKSEAGITSNKNRRWMRPAYIASYATAAGIVIALAVFFGNSGFFNKGMLESAEMAESEQQIKFSESDEAPGRNNLLATEEGFADSGSGTGPVPAPEIDSQNKNIKEPGLTVLILDDSEYSFYTSAFAGDYSIEYNSEGEDLASAYGFTNAQDILYATANYSLSEISEILLIEFGLRTIESGDNYIVINIPVSVVTPIEKRLDLAAAKLADENLQSYTVRIITLD